MFLNLDRSFFILATDSFDTFNLSAATLTDVNGVLLKIDLTLLMIRGSVIVLFLPETLKLISTVSS